MRRARPRRSTRTHDGRRRDQLPGPETICRSPSGLTMRTCFWFTSISPSWAKRDKHAADGLQLEPEETADLRAGHAQHELGARITARLEALRQVQQEGGKAFLGVHAAQQQHHAVFAHDLAAHHLVEMIAQHRHRRGHVFQAIVRNHAHFGVLQGHRVAGVGFSADAVQARPVRPPCGSRSPARDHPATSRCFSGIPSRTAYSDSKRSPARNSESPAFDPLARGNEFVQLSTSFSDSPTGRHSSPQVAVRAGHPQIGDADRWRVHVAVLPSLDVTGRRRAYHSERNCCGALWAR